MKKMQPAHHEIQVPAQREICDGHQLHYYEWGDSLNPRKLLCIHALTRNGRDFDYLAEALATDYHVICPDMPGRGKSPWLENKGQYTYATYLHDILRLQQQLGFTQFDWVGTSMGGIIGMMLASIRPDLIGRLVINDIGALITGDGLERIVSYVHLNGPYNTFGQAKQALRERYAGFGIRQEEHWRHLYEHSIVQQENRRYYFAYDPDLLEPLKRETDNFSNLGDISLADYWNTLQCPVLLLRGMQSDILTRSTAESMLTSYAGSTLIEYSETGHAPALMEKQQIDDIKRWLLAD